MVDLDAVAEALRAFDDHEPGSNWTLIREGPEWLRELVAECRHHREPPPPPVQLWRLP